MKLGLCAVLLVACGGQVATPPAPEQPTIFCSSLGQACSSGWKSGGVTKCSGAIDEDAGGCDLLPGAGADAGWYYCCPGGNI